jgi:hypothetical protein
LAAFPLGAELGNRFANLKPTHESRSWELGDSGVTNRGIDFDEALRDLRGSIRESRFGEVCHD